MYVPPFTVSSRAIHLIAKIAAQMERYAIRLEQADGLRLRKANRIKTIHSSLAIEGNPLSESQVSDIIDGKNVVAPLRQIQEVKNAIATYQLYPTLDPFRLEDMLKAHGVMMQALLDDAGHFRKVGVGVFSEQGCVHLAPPADLVPFQMKDLFTWLSKSDDHLLIRSCVFHYEFEFIHPFADGNGRMGRLWQSLILGRLHPLFEHLPIENMVYNSQQGYYDVIRESSRRADCEPFIDFMLGEILNTLLQHQGDALQQGGENVGIDVGIDVSINEEKVLFMMSNAPKISVKEISERIGLTLRQTERIVAGMKQKGILRRVGTNRSGHWEIITPSES